MMRRGLSKRQRLTRSRDFQSLYACRRSAADERLILYARPNGLSLSRIGLSVSGRWGNSVERNYFRRICREAFRLHKHELPAGYDFVIIPRRGIDLTLEEVTTSLRKLTAKACHDSLQR
jgi:ribonuclease P protein component